MITKERGGKKTKKQGQEYKKTMQKEQNQRKAKAAEGKHHQLLRKSRKRYIIVLH